MKSYYNSPILCVFECVCVRVYERELLLDDWAPENETWQKHSLWSPIEYKVVFKL